MARMVAIPLSENPAARRVSPALSFALFAGLVAFALAAFSPALLNDSDTYWHIRAGEWMLAHGAVLRSDPFSYTYAGAPWQTQEWLAETLMAMSWHIKMGSGGWAGVHLLFALAAGATAAIVANFVRRRLELVPALLVTVLGLACVSGSLLARPHLLALPLLALWVAELVAAREQDRAPRWWLVAVMPLWANLHGSFAFGLALAAALAVEAVIAARDRRRAALVWGLFVLAAIASAMLTPQGLQGLLFPLRLSAMHGLGHIGEWQASDFSHISPLAIALLASLFVFARGQVIVPLFRLVLLMGLVYLALAHARHQMLLGVAGTMLLTPSLGRAWPAREEAGSPLLLAAAGLLLVAAAFARLMMPVMREDDAVTPAAAIAHVPTSVRTLPVLNDYTFGGYLIWSRIRPSSIAAQTCMGTPIWKITPILPLRTRRLWLRPWRITMCAGPCFPPRRRWSA